MSAILHWDLIHLFNFYLAFVFLLSTYLRVRQYAALFRLVSEAHRIRLAYRTIFLTFGNLLPTLTALALFLANMLAARLVWPHAQLTIGRLLEIWPAVPFVLACGAAMLAVDIYATAWVTDIDRAQIEKYFDQAEFWLCSWTAPVVRVVTLGRINPRQMVNVEVRKALLDVSCTINNTMWWLAAQTGLRIAYGLSLWLTFALAG